MPMTSSTISASIKEKPALGRRRAGTLVNPVGRADANASFSSARISIIDVQQT
jgi:hypothetical protein